jgi:hypothetical protein
MEEELLSMAGSALFSSAESEYCDECGKRFYGRATITIYDGEGNWREVHPACGSIG